MRFVHSNHEGIENLLNRCNRDDHTKVKKTPYIFAVHCMRDLPSQASVHVIVSSGVARGGLGGQLPPPFFKNNVIKTFVIDVR